MSVGGVAIVVVGGIVGILVVGVEILLVVVVVGYFAVVGDRVAVLRKVGRGICCDVRWEETGGWEGEGEVW